MRIKTGMKEMLWMIPGAVMMLLLLLVVWHFQKKQDPAAQLAWQVQKNDVVVQMQLNLATASELEKSAVLSTNDKDVQTFVDQERAAVAEVDRQRLAFEAILKVNGNESEHDLLAQFSQVFLEFRQIDDELMNLAVKNTNIKAYELAYGPGLLELNKMNAALSRLMETHSQSTQANKVILAAVDAQIGALNIQTLLPLHISEENDQNMDALEAKMVAEDARVRKSLSSLTESAMLAGNADIESAEFGYARFSDIKSRILMLSRENTNVRSMGISLNQKRKAMLRCQMILNALKQTIQHESPAGAHGPLPKPR